MKEVFVLCGVYGDVDSTCFGVFSSESECLIQLSRLQRAFEGSIWRVFYRSFILDDCGKVDGYINSIDF